MTEFFHNLSIQALNLSIQVLNEMDDEIDAINDLHKNRNNLLITEANKFKTLPKEIPRVILLIIKQKTKNLKMML